MELRILGCAVLAYVSVYVLFWLFDNHDALLHAPAASSFKKYLSDIVGAVADYFIGFFTFAARTVNLKINGVQHFPPAVQIWGAVAILFIVGFLFSNILVNEAFGMIAWEHLGLLAVIVLVPGFKLARARFAKKP